PPRRRTLPSSGYPGDGRGLTRARRSGRLTDMGESCCAPGRKPSAAAADAAPARRTPRKRPRPEAGTVLLPGGTFLMGGADPDANVGDGEGPVRRVTVRPFRIDECAVTNRQFAAFVRDTGYVTEAERFGWSFV